jgi:hypothetical protein
MHKGSEFNNKNNHHNEIRSKTTEYSVTNNTKESIYTHNELNYIIKYSKCLLKLNSYALRPMEPKIPQTQIKCKLKFKKKP